MKKWINRYFEFSKREFNGLLVLMVLIAVFAFMPYLIRHITPEQDAALTDSLIAAAISEQIKSGESRGHFKYDFPVKSKWNRPAKQQRLFDFDPNTIDLNGWMALGLSEKQGMAILKYRAAGGRFKKKEDLARMYTISPELYLRLIPYINIHVAETGPFESRVTNVGPAVPVRLPVSEPIEVNSADSVLLCEVRGIGPAFASRIIRYRARLGGFHRKEQLMEVYGLDSLKYAGISGQVWVDPGLLKKVNINLVQPEELKNHPYIRYKQINALIEYRKQHGNYSNIADLNKVVLLDRETIARLSPYLFF